MDGNDKFKVFLGGLPASATQNTVSTYFSNFGEVLFVSLKVNPMGHCMGFGSVEMQGKQDVDRILTSGPHYLAGQKVDVKPFQRFPDENKVFIGGLPLTTTDDSLRGYFCQFGTIVDGAVRMDPVTNRSRGFAIMTFEDPSIVESILAIQDHQLDGKTIEVKRVQKPGDRMGRRGGHGGGGGGGGLDGAGVKAEENENVVNDLFIGGLTPQTTKESMNEYFSQFGPVVSTSVATDKNTQKKRGFGFVRFEDNDSIERCMAARPHTLDGKQVETKRALSSDDAKNMFTVTKLFVGALKGAHTEENIREYFGKYGSIVNLQMNRPDGAEGHRGFGFITFDDYDSVDKVIMHRNHVINGMPVDCHKGLNKDELLKLQLQVERDRLSREARSLGLSLNLGGSGAGRDPYGSSGRGGAAAVGGGSMGAGAGGRRGGYDRGASVGGSDMFGSDRYGSGGGAPPPSHHDAYEPKYNPYADQNSHYRNGSTAGPSRGGGRYGNDYGGGRDSYGGQSRAGGSADITMSAITSKPPSSYKSPNHVQGESFRQLLLSTQCSSAGITTLLNENLLDSAVLLSLTPGEFDNLPLSVGDKKRIEIALRTLNSA